MPKQILLEPGDTLVEKKRSRLNIEGERRVIVPQEATSRVEGILARSTGYTDRTKRVSKHHGFALTTTNS